MVLPTSKCETLVELLMQRAAVAGSQPCLQSIGAGGQPGPWLSYGELDAQARAIAARLEEAGLRGERALLVYPPGVDFVAAYFGCLYAAVTAVPAYPPGMTRASTTALQGIFKDAEPRAVLCPAHWARESQLRRALDEIAAVPCWIGTDELPPAGARTASPQPPRGSDLAFLQYTSGSTGAPKGVMVSHANLMANLGVIQREFALTERDHVCSWLPPYHDMGLIGGILSAVHSGYPLTLMTPAQFVRAPLAWLEVISKLRITCSGAPNFAYERCVQAARSAAAGSLQLDLTSLELLFTGAEMVRADTLERFAETFARYGFRRESFMPCYGMAECTLLCSNARRQHGSRTLEIDRAALAAERRAVPLAKGTAQEGWAVVSCGQVSQALQVRIVDPESGRACPDGTAGEIWISGPSVATGYWNRPDASAQTFAASLEGEPGRTFLRSGDRGFRLDGELYVVGRYKHIIVVRGRNVAAEDIEDSVRKAHAALQARRCAATVADPLQDDSLVIVVECEPRQLGAEKSQAEARRAILLAISERVVADHGIEPSVIALVKPGEIPATTSGKVQRQRCAELWSQNGFTLVEQRPRSAATGREQTQEARGHAGKRGARELETLSWAYDVIERHTRARPLPTSRLRDLGVDSLKALEIVVELSDRLGVQGFQPSLDPELSVEQLLEQFQRESGQGAGQGGNGAHAASPIRFARAAQSRPPLAERIERHRQELDQLRDGDVLNYNLVQGRRIDATRSLLDGQELEVFSSYSYLGLNFRPEVVEAKVGAILRHGSGAHGVMLLSGYTQEHEQLERKLAAVLGAEAAILYSSGYVANLAAIDSVMSAGGCIYCDMLAHTSIADGCRLCDAEVWMFPHQDAQVLDRMLARRPPGAPALVILDGVYSLRGEIANLPALLAVARRHGAMLMVDDAHALGAIGATGRGTAEHHGVLGQPDLITGGLGKSIPAYGGFVAGRRDVIEYLRYRSRPYVYSGGMDVANVAAATRALDLLQAEPEIMQRLHDNVALLERLLVSHGIPSLRWGSPCAPVVCRDDREAHALSREMRRRGYYIAPIVHPAVPRDQQGLRLTVTAAHSAEQIQRVVRVLHDALAELRGAARASEPGEAFLGASAE